MKIKRTRDFMDVTDYFLSPTEGKKYLFLCSIFDL